MAGKNTNTQSKQIKVDTKGLALKKKKKTKRMIIICSVILVCILAGIIFVPRLLTRNRVMAASVTTYHAEAITTGDVDTTISGSGTLTPVSKDTITTNKPVTVSAVNYSVGDEVEEDAVIATATDADGNTIEYTAPYACVLIELPIAAEDELAMNSEIAMVMGQDGFTMGIAVDELDIATVKVGQEVTFSIDAVDGEYVGAVTAVSYNGSTSGGATAYQITAKVDYVEGVYPGMSVTAEIVIEASGEGLLVPVEAVHTSGDDNYVYLAPSDAESGTEYAEDELTLSELTKVNVETGMSDGTYILIESDELADGDLIIITKLTATQTGSDSDEEGGFGGGGFLGGGGFPGGGGFGGRGEGGGMDFGDFDFENFDPSNMPQGGGFSGF